MVAEAVAAIALGLLGASGVVKLIDPGPTTGAMSTAGLPASNFLSGILGITELVAAAVALALSGVALFAAALLYMAFGIFAANAIVRRLPIQSCGCFGRDDTPPTLLHVIYDFTAGSALVAVAVGGLEPVNWSLRSVHLVLYLTFAVVGVYASYLLLTRLPQVLDSAKHP